MEIWAKRAPLRHGGFAEVGVAHQFARSNEGLPRRHRLLRAPPIIAPYFGELLVRIVRERDLGILMVEHDMSLVLGICEWIYVLDFGRLS